MKFIKTCVLIASVFLTGCVSTITAIPGGSSGIPYYLPRPYLLITKNICSIQTKTTVTKEKNKTVETTEPVRLCDKDKGPLSFQIIYLPDLTQKHSLKMIPRTGRIDTKIRLIDGWQLVDLNLDANADTANIIESVGSAVSSVTSLGNALGYKGISRELKTEEAGLWLYEISVEDGRLKYELVIEWPPR